MLSDFFTFEKMDQRICIKFYLKNGIKCSIAFKIPTVTFGELTISMIRVYEWYRRFKDGREDVEDDGCSRRSITNGNIEKVSKKKNKFGKLPTITVLTTINLTIIVTIREVVDEDGKSFGSRKAFFLDVLGITRIVATFVLKLLNFNVYLRFKSRTTPWQ